MMLKYLNARACSWQAFGFVVQHSMHAVTDGVQAMTHSRVNMPATVSLRKAFRLPAVSICMPEDKQMYHNTLHGLASPVLQL